MVETELDEPPGQQPKRQTGTGAAGPSTLCLMSGTFLYEKEKRLFLDLVSVKVLTYLDILLAVLVLGEKSGKVPRSELAVLVVI